MIVESDDFKSHAKRAAVKDFVRAQNREARGRALRMRVIFAGVAGIVIWGAVWHAIPGGSSETLTASLPWLGWLAMLLPTRFTPLSIMVQVAALLGVWLSVDGVLDQPIWWRALVILAWTYQVGLFLRFKWRSRRGFL